MNIETIGKFVPTIALLVFGALEALGGLYAETKRSKDDFRIEIISLVTLPTLIQPAIMLLVTLTLEALAPQWYNSLAHLSVWAMLTCFLILDDMTQYWWHRLAHVNKFFWKLHRPHHVIAEMGVLVTYRNAMLYYAMMPGIWFSAVLVYLGMGYVYIWYIAVKMIVIIGAHSETRWDAFLYRYRWLHPIAWIVERTISTPATHFAHHGLSDSDGVSHPNGNFGNLLFFWDVLFGTAKITRQYPEQFGAWNKMKEPWHIQLLFPILRSPDPKSELHNLLSQNDPDPTKL